ncbi:hypothetical protein TNCV_406441 [Trichonephila clavipes]|nr:hypothetical protein TNCV_406441 [Trichonephila clavipes]
MFDPSSFANPTPLAHADTSRDVLPKGVLHYVLPLHHEDDEEAVSPLPTHLVVQNIEGRFRQLLVPH